MVSSNVVKCPPMKVVVPWVQTCPESTDEHRREQREQRTQRAQGHQWTVRIHRIRRVRLTKFVAATAAVPSKEKDHEGMDKGQKHPKEKHACVETGFCRAGVVQAWVPVLIKGE